MKIKGMIRQIRDSAKEPDFSPNGTKIELFGNREATVDGCYGFLEYREELIRLNIGSGTVAIFGSGLYAYSFEGNAAVIRGTIERLDFSGGDVR